MKCPKCGYEQAIYDDINEWWHCPQCHGSGEVQMTEQEYIQTCTTEQLAEWMALRLNPGILLALRMKYHCTDINAVRKWLKEKHD